MKTVKDTDLLRHLQSLGKPPDGFLEWVGGKTAKEAWEQCVRPDWLLWWAAGTSENDTRMIKLATHDIASVISQPKIEPLPAWADTIGRMWGSDPRNPERMQAWAEWAAWCETLTLADDFNDFNKRVCDTMRKYRLRLPWHESAVSAPTVVPEQPLGTETSAPAADPQPPGTASSTTTTQACSNKKEL